MGNKLGSTFHAQRSLLLDLGAEPDPKFQNPLKLLCVIVPTVIVAQGVGREVVLNRVVSPCAVSEDVVCIPLLAVDCPATDVTTTTSLAENLGPLGFREALPGRPGSTK
jgi:hypothetical protein